MTIYLFGLITLAIGIAAFAALEKRRRGAMKPLPLKIQARAPRKPRR